jgi:uncharacterized protein YcfJ
MRVLSRVLVLSTLVVAAACGHKDGDRAVFRNSDDLLLPNASNGALLSPLELGLQDSLAASAAPVASVARAPTRAAPAPRRSSRGYASRSPARSSRAPAARRPVAVRHTRRDAAVGAAAGAVLGATIDRNRVRGAVVGGVIGGIVGGVIGNKVDVSREY